MKNITVIVLFVLFASFTSYSQELKFSDVGTTYTDGDFQSYISKDGVVYNIKDKVKIGTPSTNKTFAFILIWGSRERQPLGINASGNETAIKRIYIKGNKRAGYIVSFESKGYTFLDTYGIDIENAIASGEIKSSRISSDDALSELKKAKDKLDLELISQEKYDSIKTALKKYIK